MLTRRLATWFVLASCLAQPLTGWTKGNGVPPAPTDELRPIKVAANTYYVQGETEMGSPQNRNFISNAGFVITDGGVVVIDALGSPALAKALIAAIKKLTAQPIRIVVVTHYHADHIYGLQVFKALGARIIAHAAGQAYLSSDIGAQRLASSRQTLAPWIDDTTRLVGADEWVTGEKRFSLGKQRFVIKPVGPAHTAEDIALFAESLGVLFVGDLMFKSRIPFVGNADSKGWIAALTEIIKVAPRIIVPGHGSHSNNALREAKFTSDYLTYLRTVMTPAAVNLDSFDDAYRAADWSEFEAYPLFGAVNRMNAYNIYLSIQQEAP